VELLDIAATVLAGEAPGVEAPPACFGSKQAPGNTEALSAAAISAQLQELAGAARRMAPPVQLSFVDLSADDATIISPPPAAARHLPELLAAAESGACRRLGEAYLDAESGTGGLSAGPQPPSVRRTFLRLVESRGRRFLVGSAVDLAPLGERAAAELASLRRYRVLAVAAYGVVWLLIAGYVFLTRSVSIWLLGGVALVIGALLWFQVAQTGDVAYESALFDKLRVILPATAGLFVSLAIFFGEPRLQTELRVASQRYLIYGLLVIGLALSFATFAINPRRTDRAVLRQLNVILRVALALAFSCIATFVLVVLARYVRARGEVPASLV
jgi:hypothetical protein